MISEPLVGGAGGRAGHGTWAGAALCRPVGVRRTWRSTQAGLMLFAALTIGGCTREESPAGQIAATTPAPAIDRSSAESALRAYWSILDWYGGRFVVGRVKPDPQGKEALIAALHPLVVDSVAHSFGERLPTGRRFTGKIQSIEAVAGANPPQVDVHTELAALERSEATLTPTPVELFVGESFGGAFRYRMIHLQEGWRVAEVWRNDAGAPAQRLR